MVSNKPMHPRNTKLSYYYWICICRTPDCAAGEFKSRPQKVGTTFVGIKSFRLSLRLHNIATAITLISDYAKPTTFI
jgi:hypothetical protein